MTEQNEKRSSPLMIALAWAVVVIPTAWGFSHTLTSAMQIFTASSAGIH
jgi:hypothetical protein